MSAEIPNEIDFSDGNVESHYDEFIAWKTQACTTNEQFENWCQNIWPLNVQNKLPAIQGDDLNNWFTNEQQRILREKQLINDQNQIVTKSQLANEMNCRIEVNEDGVESLVEVTTNQRWFTVEQFAANVADDALNNSNVMPPIVRNQVSHTLALLNQIHKKHKNKEVY